MTGAELVTCLRASGYDFPIVLTAATPALAAPLLQLDCIEFIAKPFELELLLDRVRRHVAPAVIAFGSSALVRTPVHILGSWRRM